MQSLISRTSSYAGTSYPVPFPMNLHSIQDCYPYWCNICRTILMQVYNINYSFPCGYQFPGLLSHSGIFKTRCLHMWVHDIQDIFSCGYNVSRCCFPWDYRVCSTSHVGTEYSGLLPMFSHLGGIWYPCLLLMWAQCFHDYLQCRDMISRTASHGGIWYIGLFQMHVHDKQDLIPCWSMRSRTSTFAIICCPPMPIPDFQDMYLKVVQDIVPYLISRTAYHVNLIF